MISLQMCLCGHDETYLDACGYCEGTVVNDLGEQEACRCTKFEPKGTDNEDLSSSELYE